MESVGQAGFVSFGVWFAHALPIAGIGVQEPVMLPAPSLQYCPSGHPSGMARWQVVPVAGFSHVNLAGLKLVRAHTRPVWQNCAAVGSHVEPSTPVTWIETAVLHFLVLP